MSRHIKENIPFRGTVAYSTREHTYDNELTELIRHTIEYIKTHPMGNGVLNCDQETKDAVMTMTQATPTYNTRDRNRIINLNLRPVTHPYYSEYTALQKICLQILRHEALKYGQEKDRIYGVLFDGAWLWEEYLNTIFTRAKMVITHAKNKTGENGIAIYKNGKKCYYPDFYRKTDAAETSFVLDAKYKHLAQDVVNIGREDLFQMITYMHVLPARHCALLYPIELKESNTSAIVSSSPLQLQGDGGEIIDIGISIASEAVYSTFYKYQEKTESNLVDEIKNWMGKPAG